MANSLFLRDNLNQHTIKNNESKKMDKDIDVAVQNVIFQLKKDYPEIIFTHKKQMMLKDIVAILAKQFPEYSSYFACNLETSFIRPDGGFLFATNKQGERRLILVSEVKRQGTNDARKKEGKPKNPKLIRRIL